MTNWRLLEAEIIDILRKQGVGNFLHEASTGDKFLLDDQLDLNITEFASALADRVSLNTKAVQVKTEPANSPTQSIPEGRGYYEEDAPGYDEAS